MRNPAEKDKQPLDLSWDKIITTPTCTDAPHTQAMSRFNS